MKQTIHSLALLTACAAAAQAHFPFVVPDPGNGSAKVFLSETLQPDDRVEATLIRGTKLSLRAAGGAETPLPLAASGSVFTVSLSGAGTRVIHGITDLGMMQRGQGKAHLLIYYPKTILGDAFAPSTVLGPDTPVELVPTGRPGAVSLQLLTRGQPAADAEITVILPDGSEKKMRTDASGKTEALAATGRYGAWARYWETAAGERDGKKYEEVRHYATLVFDVEAAPASFAKLPQATSSFGAVASDGYLYVYGGHVSPTHTYFDTAVSGRFSRLDLRRGTWEELPAGPGLQGLNLAVYHGQIYRAGGMKPRNKKGEKADNYSTAECARFDPASGRWEELPPLPQPRSSHDVAVVGGQLIVVGGWDIHGQREEWMDSLVVMDLAAGKPEWKTVPQPFHRRALIAAAYRDKLYVIGGFDDKNQITRAVSIYDPKTGEWSEGPELPANAGMAFAPAAVVTGERLYVSVADGELLSLNPANGSWQPVAKATGRVAHRLAAWQGKVLVIGGASDGRNFDLVEAIPVAQ